MKTCLHRFLGECIDCSEDYNQEHFPNNTNCRNYYEINILAVDILPAEKQDQSGMLKEREK